MSGIKFATAGFVDTNWDKEEQQIERSGKPAPLISPNVIKLGIPGGQDNQIIKSAQLPQRKKIISKKVESDSDSSSSSEDDFSPLPFRESYFEDCNKKLLNWAAKRQGR